MAFVLGKENGRARPETNKIFWFLQQAGIAGFLFWAPTDSLVEGPCEEILSQGIHNAEY